MTHLILGVLLLCATVGCGSVPLENNGPEASVIWEQPPPRPAVAAGFDKTCAVSETGSLRCWGDGIRNRLGYGNELNIGDDETPASVGDLDVGGGVQQVDVSLTHTCVVLDTGAVRCWGGWARGTLGLVSGDYSPVPDPLTATPAAYGVVDVGGNVVQITTGTDHTCALLQAGTVRCWGADHFGELGYAQGAPAICGDTPCDNLSVGDDETPASMGDVEVGGEVKQIAAGDHYTCAVLVDGALSCWGQLSFYGYDLVVSGDQYSVPAAGDRLDIGGLVSQVVLGQEHACALLSSGTVRCWGSPLWGGYETGQLGYANDQRVGDDEPPAAAGDVAVGGKVVQLTAGAHHTCALLETGTVRCWGSGEYGQLGYGNWNNIGDDETPASAGDVDVGGRVVKIDAGFSHTCALLEGGSLHCWGGGYYGALGYGNVESIGDDETPASAGDVDVF